MTAVYNTNNIVNQQVVPKLPQPFDLDKKYENLASLAFDFSDTSLNPVDLAERLIQTAKKYNSYSCCANQVGVNLSVFVAGFDENWVAFFNPKLIGWSDEVEKSKESDTISDPGLVLNITRHKTVKFKYNDYTGKEHVQEFSGLTAKILQQCFFRLAGYSFKDGVSKLQLNRAEKALNKKIKTVVRNQMKQLKVRK